MKVLINSLVFLLLVFSGCGSGSDNCKPSCAGRVCGWDPVCGTMACGTCTGGETCNEQGQCETECTPSCTGRECGPDGCEGTCPPGCGVGEQCNETSGQCECAPNCTGKECGSDGCGGTCSPGCGAGENCNNGVCEIAVWIQIPGGTYQMGSDVGNTDETPLHSVTVPSFEMTKTEVTVDQYQACVDAVACTLPDDNTVSSYCNWGASGRGAHPVNCVDWNQAAAFCIWAGGRLPSESEWEYAARSGGQDITYPWGDDTATCQYAVMYEAGLGGCGLSTTWAACGKTAGNTAQGLCDMAGNVWEWVQDWYHGDYTMAPADGSAWDDSGSLRVNRGGGFVGASRDLRAALRYYDVPSERLAYLGFRCAR